jgi:hypothetical protein
MARLGLRDLGGPFLSALLSLPEAKGLWLGSIALIASPTSNFRVSHSQAEMNSKAKSLEECLQEAAECERLARPARSKEARTVMKLSAAVWRKRAREAAEQEHPYWH